MLSCASLLGARVTVKVYVFVVVPSWAVIVTSTVLLPTISGKAADVVPLATNTGVPPFTRASKLLTLLSVAVGVTVIVVVAFGTLAV